MRDKNQAGLVRQWPGYLWRGAAAAAVSVLLQLAADLAFGERLPGVANLAGAGLGNFVFFALAQALFPPFVVRFKRIPTALGVSLALGGLAGYAASMAFSLLDAPRPFVGREVFILLFLGAFLGLATGGGWNLSKGRAVGFWALFLAACAAVTAFFHFTAPAEVRGTVNILHQGLTLVASYAPVVAVIWWRHRPRGGRTDSAPPREESV